MTCRNSEPTIMKVLVSIKQQVVRPEYVIVIDDGSTDGTKNILKEMKKEWGTLYVINNPDLGYDTSRIVKNINAAIKLSRDKRLPKTDYHLIATDDTIYPEFYAKNIISYMDAKPGVAIVSGIYNRHGLSIQLGAGRFIRNSFFEETSWLGYYPEQLGYESAIIHEASRCGYSYKTLDCIKFEQIKPLCQTQKIYELGASMRMLGYHPLFVLARFLKYIITGEVIGRRGSICMIYFYMSYSPKSVGYDKMYDQNLRRYVRSYQIKKLKGILNRWFRTSPGIRYAISPNGFLSLLYFVYCRKVRRQNTILFQGKAYRYFDTDKTWYNERAVEIPIIMELVRKYLGKNILEIGNVLSHHIRFEHDIIDKYEIAKGVTNADVADFKSEKKYDLIVSISTLEHVGWDEKPRDDMKIPRAIENLKTLASRGGTIIVTLPLGYNTALDQLLKDGIIRFSKQYHLVRISKGNEWKEASWNDVQDARYNAPLPFANALLIGIITVESQV
ncbi:MAG TPA: glycosyltransferase [Nitrososphaeraceae archaeon]|nr:glycosyltransferase [Nitrososphaeraceae archaeon]